MKTFLILSFIAIFVIMPFRYAQSEIPKKINYQAKLFDDQNNPLQNGIYTFTFSIFEQKNGGSPVWTETQDVEVKEGFVNVYLGSNTPLNLKFDKQFWLEVKIAGENPFTRTPLASVPTTFNSMESMNADVAVTVVDRSITNSKLAENSVTSDKINNGTIVNADISNNANISVSKLAPGNNGEVLMTKNNSVEWSSPEQDGDAWRLTGNAGTVEGTNFLGTTDNTPLELRVANSDTIRNVLILNNNGSLQRDNLSLGASYVLGDARGENAVDLQNNRKNSTQVASGSSSVICGGSLNTATGGVSSIGGGIANRAEGTYSTIAGGKSNTTYSIFGFIGGGEFNQTNDDYGTVAGGKRNQAKNAYSVVCGGEQNIASGRRSTIAGGATNRADTSYSFVGGGSTNWVTGINGAIVGGYYNKVSNTSAFVGGGFRNTSSGRYSVNVGGDRNNSSGEGSTVGGGGQDSAKGNYSTVSGGRHNKTDKTGSTVSGGIYNTANAEYSTVAGGYQALADKYGQNAYASGEFANIGDAQTSVFVVRNVTNIGSNTVELFLDGSGQRMSLNEGDAWAFRALVVGKDNTNLHRAAYILTGLITKNGTNTSIYAPTTTVIYEQNSSYDARAIASNGSLVIRVTGDIKFTMRWVARVEVAQLNY